MKLNMYELVTYLKDRAYDKAPQLATMVGVLMNSSVINKKDLYRIMPMNMNEIEDCLSFFERSNFIRIDEKSMIHTDGLELLLSRAETYYYSLAEDMPITIF